MKKILITLFQLTVTIAVLYWVYHDPTRRAQMAAAIRDAQYRWVVIAILAYVVVEIAPVSARGHRRRYHEKLLPAQGNAG